MKITTNINLIKVTPQFPCVYEAVSGMVGLQILAFNNQCGVVVKQQNKGGSDNPANELGYFISSWLNVNLPEYWKARPDISVTFAAQ